MLVWIGTTLILDGWWRRENPHTDLSDRLWPFRPRSLAEEAQDWLDSGKPLD
jgi:hypothetical protein